MTEEDKKLLYVDLCGRLPYDVIIREYNEEYGYNDHKLSAIQSEYFSESEPDVEGYWMNRLENIKPYLRRLESMTVEEQNLLRKETGAELYRNHIGFPDTDEFGHIENYYEYDWIAVFDWLNKHHFDYRSLIDKGLAIEQNKE